MDTTLVDSGSRIVIPSLAPLSFHHYTSLQKLGLIQKSGLKPCTRIPGVLGNRYIVGIFPSDEEKWKDFGLWTPLMSRTSGRVRIRADITQPERCFVREHAHSSPKRFIEICGKNLFTEMPMIGGLRDIYRTGWRKYELSSTPLIDYDGSFQCPELWVGEHIQPKDLTIKIFEPGENK